MVKTIAEAQPTINPWVRNAPPCMQCQRIGMGADTHCVHGKILGKDFPDRPQWARFELIYYGQGIPHSRTIRTARRPQLQLATEDALHIVRFDVWRVHVFVGSDNPVVAEACWDAVRGIMAQSLIGLEHRRGSSDVMDALRAFDFIDDIQTRGPKLSDPNEFRCQLMQVLKNMDQEGFELTQERAAEYLYLSPRQFKRKLRDCQINWKKAKFQARSYSTDV
jgi:hypothetical protein